MNKSKINKNSDHGGFTSFTNSTTARSTMFLNKSKDKKVKNEYLRTVWNIGYQQLLLVKYISANNAKVHLET